MSAPEKPVQNPFTKRLVIKGRVRYHVMELTVSNAFLPFLRAKDHVHFPTRPTFKFPGEWEERRYGGYQMADVFDVPRRSVEYAAQHNITSGLNLESPNV